MGFFKYFVNFVTHNDVNWYDEILYYPASRNQSRLGVPSLRIKGSLKNNFPFSHPIFRSSLAISHSQNPQNSPAFSPAFSGTQSECPNHLIPAFAIMIRNTTICHSYKVCIILRWRARIYRFIKRGKYYILNIRLNPASHHFNFSE